MTATITANCKRRRLTATPLSGRVTGLRAIRRAPPRVQRRLGWVAVGGTTLITGGAGYIGMLAAEQLLEAGHEVRVLDSLLHGQEDLAASLRERGVELIAADVRDAAARGEALRGADAVVHLAAIVGDPACALDPEAAQAVNVDASMALIEDAAAAGVSRFVMASTCSNYGRMADPTVPINETACSPRCRSTPSRRWRSRRRCSRSTRRRSRSPACASPPSTASRRGCASTSPSTSSRATCGRTAGSRCSASSSGGPTSTSATPRAGSAPCSRRRPSWSPARSSTSATRPRTTASSTSWS